ncbi:MAG: L,D-transpeptidase [Thermoleophilia bacterium]|nr:L,D-transpeptidase [Thermoleophilia bacterium]MDH3725085.1 L,D-transpeptidase [Thermoleophilia bacterium]
MRAQIPALTVGLAAVALAVATSATAAAPAPRVTAFSATPIVDVGKRTTVKGRISPARSTKVYIERRLPNYGWKRLAVVKSDQKGRFHARLPLRSSMRLRASIKVDGRLTPGPQRVNAALRRRAAIAATVDAKEAIAGRPIQVKGRVWPARPGERAIIEASRGSRVVRLARPTVRPGGRIAASVRVPAEGAWRLRLIAPGRKGVDRKGSAAARTIRFFARNPHGVPKDASHYIVQDLSERRLYYYERGTLRRVHEVVFGKPATPTPLGRYRVYSKTNGPRAAFGPKVLWYYRGYGIHGTNQEHLLKHVFRYYSLGCTRNTNADILWLWPRVPLGTPVVNIA